MRRVFELEERERPNKGKENKGKGDRPSNQRPNLQDNAKRKDQ